MPTSTGTRTRGTRSRRSSIPGRAAAVAGACASFSGKVALARRDNAVALSPSSPRGAVRLTDAAAMVFGRSCHATPAQATVAVAKWGLALSDLLYFGPLVMAAAAVSAKGALPPATRSLLWRGGAFAAAGGAVRLILEARHAPTACAR